MPNSYLFGVSQNNNVFILSTNDSSWKEFWSGPSRKIKKISSIPHFVWAIGSDFQVYLYVYGLDVPIIVEEEVFENERWIPIDGFCEKLLPTDRYHYSSEDGRRNRDIESIRVPSMAWQWDCDWKIDTSLNGQQLDHDGWTYAMDFVTKFTPTKQWNSCVRRRRWVRSRRYSAMNAWCAIAPLNRDPTKEPFMDIAVGGEGNVDVLPGTLSVWAVTTNGRVMYRNGVNTNWPEGSRWTNVPLPDEYEAQTLTISANGSVWVLTSTGIALVRFMITKNVPFGEKWIKVESPEKHLKLVQMCCGKNAAWALTDNRRVWFRHGIHGEMINLNEDMATGTKWIEMVDKMVQISITSNDQVCALGEDNSIYYRTEITRMNETGKSWRKITSDAEVRRRNNFLFNEIEQTAQISSSLDLLKKSVKLQNSEMTSLSAPTTTLSPLLTKVKQLGDNFETEIQLKKSSSPISSAGSQVGIEACPDVDDEFDFFPGSDLNSTTSTVSPVWIFLDAGACTLDINNLPNWFPDSINEEANTYQNESWRLAILKDLKKRAVDCEIGDFELAVEDRSWNQKIYCKCVINGKCVSCVLELEYVGSNGTFTILNAEGAIVQFQFRLSEIKAIIRCSTSGRFQCAIYVPSIFNNSPTIFQFNSEKEMDNFITDLNNVCDEINLINQPPSTTSIWALTSLGDVYVSDLSLLNTEQFDGSAYKIEYDLLSNRRAATSKVYLSEGCKAGTIVQIYGRVHDDNVNGFAINFENGKHDGFRIVPLHFNVRLVEGVIVCNSYQKEWGEEVRMGNKSFTAGEAFHFKIFCEVDGFRVIMNENKFIFFDYRLPVETICLISIRGQVDVFKVCYQAPKIIVSPIDLYWRRIGGHFDKIEVSHDGRIVWAIGYDKTVWAYDSIAPWSNNTITDYRDFYLYENQRWNPLTGYTNTGLPTDRPMWSDVTGTIRRTKENTKLPSLSWTWISDWIVDFSMIGGVDEDGWQYAIDFTGSFHSKNVFTDLVRRRRWLRKCAILTTGPWKELCSSNILDLSFMNHVDGLVLVWAVTTKGDVVFCENATSLTFSGEDWIHVSSNERFISICCGDFGQVWALGNNGFIYRRCGIDEAHFIGDTWDHVKSPPRSKPKEIKIFEKNVWLLDTDGRLFCRKVITGFPEGGIHWTNVFEEKGKIMHLSISKNELWAVDSDGHLLKRYGISKDHHLGSGWITGLQLLFTWKRPKSSTTVNFCKWSKTSNDLIAVATSDCLVTIISKLGDVIYSIQLTSLCIKAQWCRQSNILAIITNDSNQLVFWNELQNSHSTVNVGVKETLSWISWSKSEFILAIGTCKGSLVLYEYGSKKLNAIVGKHLKPITTGCWSADNNLIIGSNDGTVTVNTFQGQTLKTLVTKSMVNQLKCIKDSSLISLVVNRRSLYLYDLDDLNTSPIELSFRKQYGMIVEHKWFQKSHCLIGLSAGVVIEIVYTENKVDEVDKVISKRNKLCCLHMNRDSGHVAVFDGEMLRIFQSSHLQNELLSVPIADCTDTKWSSDGQLLAVCRKSSCMSIYFLNGRIQWNYWENMVAVLTNLTSILMFDVFSCKKIGEMKLSNEIKCFTFNSQYLFLATISCCEMYKMIDFKQIELISVLNFKEMNSSIVTDLQLNTDFVSILIDGKLFFEEITSLVSDKNFIIGENIMPESRVVCQKLSQDFLYYSTEEGALIYHCICENQIAYQYRHTCQICRLFVEPFGSHLILLDVNNEVFIIDPINNDLIRVPYNGGPISTILWQNDPSNRNLFIIFSELSLLVYTYNKVGRNKAGRVQLITVTEAFLTNSQTPLLFQKDSVSICGLDIDDSLRTKVVDFCNPEDNGNYDRQLETYLKLQKYSEAISVCNILNNKSSWTNLIRVLIDNMEIELAQSICTKQKLWSLRKLTDKLLEIERVNEYFAEVAVFERDYDKAETIFLEANQIMRVIEMRKDLEQWDVALKLAQTYGLVNEVVIIAKHYAQELELDKRYTEALSFYQQYCDKFDSEVSKGMARCSLYSNNYQLGYSVVLKSDDKDLMEECADILVEKNQLIEAANLYEKCKKCNKLASVLLRMANYVKLNSILDEITDRQVLSKYAKIKESKKEFELAMELYTKAEDFDNVIRVQLIELNNPDAAVELVKARKSVAGANICSNYFMELNDYSSAVQCLLIVDNVEQAYQIANNDPKRLEAFGRLLSEISVANMLKSNLKYFEKLAIDFTKLGNRFLAGSYYRFAGNWEKALSHLLEASKNQENENEALTLAIEVAVSSNDEYLVNTLEQYLTSHKKDEPNLTRHLINLYVSREQFVQASQLGLQYAIEEQCRGNYKIAHTLLYDLYLVLDEHSLEIGDDFDTRLMMLHSYIIARIHIKRNDHDLAAKLLIRVMNYLDQFPSHTVAILTSVTIECYRADRKQDAFRFASYLMSSEHRKSIDDIFSKKIETILRRSAPVDNTGFGDNVNGDHFNDCPYCNCSQSAMNTKCDNCQRKLPLCIISGQVLQKEQYTVCPSCHFYVNYSLFFRVINEMDTCPMCTHKIDVDSITKPDQNRLISHDRNMIRNRDR